jgi:hypothetical protein
MAPLTTINAGDVLTVRVYKVLNPVQIAWANTYEIRSDNAYSGESNVSDILQTLRDLFANFERSLLFNEYLVDRVVFSTYVADSRPYDPFTFVSYPVNLAGQYTSPGFRPLPLEFCTLVKRAVPFGRQGNILYRGIVTTRDANITSAGATIIPARLNVIQDAVNTFYTSLRSLNFRLVLASGRNAVDPSTLRNVTSLSVKNDMRFKKLNNRYFDRTRNQN